MPVFNSLRKAIGQLPGIRNPQPKGISLMDAMPWLMAGSQQNQKTNANWQVYYSALDNDLIDMCVTSIATEILGIGFDIKRPDEQTPNKIAQQYFESLFQDPDGIHGDETFTMFTWKIWSCIMGTGDVFIESTYYQEIPNLADGFYYIQPHRMQYYFDTDQWGLKNSPVRFENDEIIHVKFPDVKDDLWGKSKIDKLARSITLDIMAWNFNKDFFKKGGMHPRGVIKYDPSVIDEDGFDTEIDRLKVNAMTNPRGHLLLYGGEMQDTGATNRDMEFGVLMDKIRERVMGVFGVPPSKIGIIEPGSLGNDRGVEQNKNFWLKRKGEVKLFEDAFNKVLGYSGFDERFYYGEKVVEDVFLRAQVEDIRIKNQTLKVNECRAGYNLEPVEWGEQPYSPSVAQIPLQQNTGVKNQKMLLTQNGILKPARFLQDVVTQEI